MNHLVATYGYWALVLITGVEALGVPIPGETALIAAGTYAGETHHLSVWLIWFLSAVAVTVGSFVSYWIGVRGGYRLLRRYGHYIRMDEAAMKVGRYIFDRYGAPVVAAGRFVAVLRTYAPFLAGTNRMPWAKFAVFNTVGAVAWTGLWSLLSYFVGGSLKTASTTLDYVLGAVAVVLVVAVVWTIHRQAKRLEAVAERAYPGPLTD